MKKETKMAAIVIHQKEKWMETNRKLMENKTNSTKARVVKKEIEMKPNFEEDYQRMKAYIRRKNDEFSTFDLSHQRKH